MAREEPLGEKPHAVHVGDVVTTEVPGLAEALRRPGGASWRVAAAMLMVRVVA